MRLAKLQKVELREVWRHEALDFTNWLAQPENLELLSEEIGIDISLIQTEASVGSFNVDILAEEENTGRRIVIENQFETTNHDHLGKVITYASGFDAEIIVWIVKSVRDEHKRAIDWLNEHTDEKINIFAIQMEVWKIGESACAPKFQVVAQPNDWAKALRAKGNAEDLSQTKVMQLEFWSRFNEYLQEHVPQIKRRKAQPQHWYDLSVGSSLAHLALTINSQNGVLGCELYINDSKELFEYLHSLKEQIEAELGCALAWKELTGKKACRIKLESRGDFFNSEGWPAQHNWLATTAVSFQRVFGQTIKKFTPKGGQ